MSRNEREQGTFRIPANRWTSFKGALRLAYNEGLAADLVLAEQVLWPERATAAGARILRIDLLGERRAPIDVATAFVIGLDLREHLFGEHQIRRQPLVVG